MKYNLYYQQADRPIDLSRDYLDGMTASEWVQWGKSLQWLYSGKVNRNSKSE